MVCKNCRVQGSDEYHPNELRGSFRARLSARSKLFNAQRVANTADSSKRQFILEKALFLTLPSHTVGVDITKLFERSLGHSHQARTVVLLLSS